ncbi:nitrogenase molybdenum-iron protein alpha chain [Methanosarcina sp. A14]|uniref:Nitrogenase protein alpha chain n=2 Tax=Methanosarcina barkeri TaxID=2208 RepID=A0A0E3QY37_METBA|nr:MULTISPECIES: nitrogenase molybdenum-iron protein alpha chain [Methanosarcina]AKB55787.1 Nitrogenase (molybdenum-iron) alpha chain [Methanosarcina barkeri MS]AKJ39923.1 nitrogenase molybdenum-iron protein alpha subunit NifD [Methanosarcina barkeri CM1]OED06472.1 nitrogenase molybdenum-iron protein alpha chain [Methanosarcina sp. A14]
MGAEIDSRIEDEQKLVDDMLKVLPEKAARNRRKHIVVRNCSTEQHIEADDKVIPGILTNRGCAFAGTKGVVFGPIKDMVHLVHGPIGCAFYTWGTRRNFAKAEEGGDNFMNYCVCTDMKETDIVFGGEKKLKKAIDEVVKIFHPEAITICATCPVGLIGDDIESVAREAEKEHGIKVIPARCEGYRGVSQSAGHHIASNALMEHLIGTEEIKSPTPFDINVFGEYNIGGDLWEVKPIFEKIGYRIVSSLTGDGSFHRISQAHQAKLSILLCHRSINYTNRMMEEKYGVPWLKVNYIGTKGTEKSLRKMAEFFDDPELTRKTEEVIAEEKAKYAEDIEKYRKKLKGKTAFIYAGGSRSHHYINLFEELGMKVIAAGYQFAHRDDYEGRQIIPQIKEKALGSILEDVHYERDENVKPTVSPERIEELKTKIGLMDYKGLFPDAEDGTIVIDDLNHHETEVLVKTLKPDIFCSGIKDKYWAQKLGVPSRQIHSYDYSGRYTGFSGVLNFARDIDMALHSPTWKFIRPPWKAEDVE